MDLDERGVVDSERKAALMHFSTDQVISEYGFNVHVHVYLAHYQRPTK